MLIKPTSFTLASLCLLALSCQQTSETILHDSESPIELTVQVREGKVVSNIDGEQLHSFARKLTVKNALPSERRRFTKAQIVDSHLVLSDGLVCLVTKFQSQPTGAIVKVSTSLERQANSIYTASL